VVTKVTVDVSARSEGHVEGHDEVVEEVGEVVDEVMDEVVDEVVDEVDETDTLDVTAGAMQLQALLILELEASQLPKNAGNPAVAVMA
jgi:hypothetical protein